MLWVVCCKVGCGFCSHRLPPLTDVVRGRRLTPACGNPRNCYMCVTRKMWHGWANTHPYQQCIRNGGAKRPLEQQHMLGRRKNSEPATLVPTNHRTVM